MPTVAIVGLGLIGSSLALALNDAGAGYTVVGADTDERTLRKALERGIVASASSDLGAVGIADVVVIAVPIRAVKETFAKLRGHVDGKVVTDVASTKQAVMEWAHEAGISLVGGHPMCGRESSGIDAADGSLFKAAPWVLTEAQPAVTAMVEAAGARPLVMDAAAHDRLVAGVSHAAFLLSVAYVLALSGKPDWPEASAVAASGFRDMSRLAAGDPELYAGIAATNRDEIVTRLDDVSAALARLRRHLEAGDPRLTELFEEARRIRERWAGGHTA
jgi:prephenate dehydrogenase